LYPFLLVSLGTFAYLNSFNAPFVFDSIYEIAENVSIRRLWPPWQVILAPENIGRPLVALSFALNYAVSGLDVWSYHLLNLAIHLLAGLALMGIVRRTLLSAPLVNRFGARSAAFAFVTAAVWLVHPIQTAAVTNVIQRCESLMGLFFLLTLYSVIRGASALRPGYWYVAAVASCAAGMLSKQVMVTAPIVVLAYDLLFLSRSVPQALLARRSLYMGLASTWALLIATVVASPSAPSAGFGAATISPWQYFTSELGVVCYYLRLAIWPDSLCLDYFWPAATTWGQILPYAIVLAALGGATLWAFLKRKPIAFAGIWFFLILSVTSSFMPIVDLAFDHRMYLPIAAVVALLVIGGGIVLERLGHLPAVAASRVARPAALIGASLVIGSLVVATLRRNVDYSYAIAMWQDVVAKSPNNPRGHGSLGMHLTDAGRLDEAISQFQEALRLNPGYLGAEAGLGQALVLDKQPRSAIPHLTSALRIDPHHVRANCFLGRALMDQGLLDEAIRHLSLAVEIEPTYAEAHFFLGLALSREGKPEQAQKQYQITSQLAPDLLQQLSPQLSGDPQTGR
jgi:tetratricopeptide (TPR) repeat protein